MAENQTDKNVPQHVGFIVDGNRRWAKQNQLPSLEGHRRGMENLKKIVKHTMNSGVSFVSAFVFSTENWNRTPDEVNYLMDMFLKVAEDYTKELQKEDVRLLFMGSEDRLSAKVIQKMRWAQEQTADKGRATLALCLNYGGQQEIAEAVAKILASTEPTAPDLLKLLRQNLYHPEVPDLDLIIRTSGEQRISNFMLWRAAYAELLFVDKHWPDFTEQDLDAALADYAQRQRRFGQ